MKDLHELFKACGGKILRRPEYAGGESYVEIPPELKPIDIVLRVVPTGIEFYEEPNVTLKALVSDRLSALDAGKDGAILRHTEYDVEFTLPIEAITLAQNQDGA